MFINLKKVKATCETRRQFFLIYVSPKVVAKICVRQEQKRKAA
jgi:hypothetical protein